MLQGWRQQLKGFTAEYAGHQTRPKENEDLVSPIHNLLESFSLACKRRSGSTDESGSEKTCLDVQWVRGSDHVPAGIEVSAQQQLPWNTGMCRASYYWLDYSDAHMPCMLLPRNVWCAWVAWMTWATTQPACDIFTCNHGKHPAGTYTVQTHGGTLLF